MQSYRRPFDRAAACLKALSATGLVLAGAALAGCASGGDAKNSAFVDPARYNLYDCKQLDAARQVADKRVLELQGLMAKAETGAAGSLVSGLAYQTDFVSARAQLNLIDENRSRSNCGAAAPLSDKPDIRSAPVPRGHGHAR